jgi:hypothetical protein
MIQVNNIFNQVKITITTGKAGRSICKYRQKLGRNYDLTKTEKQPKSNRRWREKSKNTPDATVIVTISNYL